MSWNKLCWPKKKGGLDFRSLEGFNQALVAKQVWRMLVFPNTPVARLFKGKYFHIIDILNAKCGHHPSYLWRSLLWGRKLLAKGIRKQIGSGANTLVYGVPWIPRETTFKIFTRCSVDSGNLRVRDLMLENGR